MLALGYRLLKPLLFGMDPERAHERVVGGVGAWPRLARFLAGRHRPAPSLALELAGLRLPGPVGLAAGLDKDAHALPVWDRLGFGFVEIGTVTPRPQAGNPRPRIHRLVPQRGLINSMGFPSEGCEVIAARLRNTHEHGLWPAVPVGVNLGKNKDTPAEQAHEDYATLTRELAPLCDYLAVNVSSPNTPGLRDLQTREPLLRILGAVLPLAQGRPVFVKLAPDMDEGALDVAVEAALDGGASGIIATNTTRQRMGIAAAEALTGGLSGSPLHPLALERVKQVLARVDGRVPVVGVGGISGPEQAQAFLDAGCRAVQLYTGLIFEGPAVVYRIDRGLVRQALSPAASAG